MSLEAGPSPVNIQDENTSSSSPAPHTLIAALWDP